MRRLLITLLVIGNFEACRPNNYLYLAGLDDTTNHVLPEITRLVNSKLGCEAWKTGRVQYDKVSRRTIFITQNSKAVKDYDPYISGFYDQFTEDIYYVELDLEYNKRIIEQILLHELGHAMRLDHEEGTIMAKARLNVDLEQGAESLANLLNKYDLNPCTNRINNE